MIINWKGTRLLALSDSVSLVPGINTVNDSEWIGFMKTKGMKRKMAEGLIELIAGEIKREPLKGPGGVVQEGKEKISVTSKELWKLEPNEAIRIVPLTLDINTLENWRKKEQREEIRLAIFQQIDKMKK